MLRIFAGIQVCSRQSAEERRPPLLLVAKQLITEAMRPVTSIQLPVPVRSSFVVTMRSRASGIFAATTDQIWLQKY
jgi:hypothetical protein